MLVMSFITGLVIGAAILVNVLAVVQKKPEPWQLAIMLTLGAVLVIQALQIMGGIK